MRVLSRALVPLLLLKSFIRVLSRQFYIKLTKFTRNSRGPKSRVRQFAAGCEFLKAMAVYNLDVITHCRCCINSLVNGNITAVLVYGEEDVIEVLRNLSVGTSMKIGILREGYEAGKNFGGIAVPVERAAASRDKIIVASIVNMEEVVGRLRKLGVDVQRIVLLR